MKLRTKKQKKLQALKTLQKMAHQIINMLDDIDERIKEDTVVTIPFKTKDEKDCVVKFHYSYLEKEIEFNIWYDLKIDNTEDLVRDMFIDHDHTPQCNAYTHGLIDAENEYALYNEWNTKWIFCNSEVMEELVSFYGD